MRFLTSVCVNFNSIVNFILLIFYFRFQISKFSLAIVLCKNYDFDIPSYFAFEKWKLSFLPESIQNLSLDWVELKGNNFQTSEKRKINYRLKGADIIY